MTDTPISAKQQAYTVQLEKFQGPLDLLLQLIEQEELDISEVSLSQVTEQYLQHLARLTTLSAEELADFLVVAAKLLYLKSKTLLPQLDMEDDEDAGTLEQQLKIYREFLDASRVINRMVRKRTFTYPREQRLAAFSEVLFTPPKRIDRSGLHTLFLEVLEAIEPLVTVPRKVIERTVTLREKISSIQDRILQHASVSFTELLQQSQNRTDIVVTFLAVLELMKQQDVLVIQERQFHDIVIQRKDTDA